MTVTLPEINRIDYAKHHHANEGEDFVTMQTFRTAMICNIVEDSVIHSWNSLDTSYLDYVLRDDFCQMMEESLEQLSTKELEQAFNFVWVGDYPDE